MAKISKIPSFIVKNCQQKPPQNRGGFCCTLGFLFLNFFVFFPSFLLISRCFMPSWNPKTAHEVWLQALYIYIYISCRVIIWAKFRVFQSYYLGQVCFVKTLFAKNTIKIGVSAFFSEKKVCTKISTVIIWAKLAIFMLQQTWPR